MGSLLDDWFAAPGPARGIDSESLRQVASATLSAHPSATAQEVCRCLCEHFSVFEVTRFGRGATPEALLGAIGVSLGASEQPGGSGGGASAAAAAAASAGGPGSGGVTVAAALCSGGAPDSDADAPRPCSCGDAAGGAEAEPAPPPASSAASADAAAAAAAEFIRSCPPGADLSLWTHWPLRFAPALGALPAFLANGRFPVPPPGVPVIAVGPEELIRLPDAPSVESFRDALSRGEGAAAAAQLLGVVAEHRSVAAAPVALLAAASAAALVHAVGALGERRAARGALRALLALPRVLRAPLAHRAFIEPLSRALQSGSQARALIREACSSPVELSQLAHLGHAIGELEWCSAVPERTPQQAAADREVSAAAAAEAIRAALASAGAAEARGDGDESSSQSDGESSLGDAALEGEEDEGPSGAAAVVPHLAEAAAAASGAAPAPGDGGGEGDEEMFIALFDDDVQQAEGEGRRRSSVGGGEIVAAAAAPGPGSEAAAAAQQLQASAARGRKQRPAGARSASDRLARAVGAPRQGPQHAAAGNAEAAEEEARARAIIEQIRRDEFGVGVEMGDEAAERLRAAQNSRLGRALQRLSTELYAEGAGRYLPCCPLAAVTSCPVSAHPDTV